MSGRSAAVLGSHDENAGVRSGGRAIESREDGLRRGDTGIERHPVIAARCRRDDTLTQPAEHARTNTAVLEQVLSEPDGVIDLRDWAGGPVLAQMGQAVAPPADRQRDRPSSEQRAAVRRAARGWRSAHRAHPARGSHMASPRGRR